MPLQSIQGPNFQAVQLCSSLQRCVLLCRQGTHWVVVYKAEVWAYRVEQFILLPVIEVPGMHLLALALHAALIKHILSSSPWLLSRCRCRSGQALQPAMLASMCT